ncbi:MAG: HisA/HisF-related TIM barrel protein [Patescibacteria group bacterium]
MKIIPAIFLQAGKAVSLYKGSNDHKKVYSKSPKNYAAYFQKEGAKILEIVDLDQKNRAKLVELRSVFHGKIWWGGGVKTIAEIESLFNDGADVVILGTSAEKIHLEALQKFGNEKIFAGVKFRNDPEAPEKCTTLVEKGFTQIIVKDMEADGALFHPNFDQVEKAAYFSKAKIYSSGGISEIQDLEIMKVAKVEGVIIARALYENRLNLSELIRRFEHD